MADDRYGDIRFPAGLSNLQISGGQILAGVLLVLVVSTLATSIYTLSPEEKGIIRRFGRYDAPPRDPGLRFKLPFGIDKLDKVPVQRQLKQEFGFKTITAATRSSFRSVPEEAMMLTGDLNMASVEWIVQYKVTDPYKYLFKVRSVEETLRDLNEAIMREIVGDRTINEVLTVGRIEIADSVKQRLQSLTNQYAMGITIDQVVLQDVNPPDPVKPSFNAVNEAQQEREKLINEARSEYNRVIPRAEGEAEKTINEARAYGYERINRSKGEAARFTALFEAYRQAPEVTRRRIYLETLSETLPKVGRKVIIDAELEGLVPLLPLGGTGGLSGGIR